MEDATVIGAVPADLLALAQRGMSGAESVEEEEATSHYATSQGLLQGLLGGGDSGKPDTRPSLSDADDTRPPSEAPSPPAIAESSMPPVSVEMSVEFPDPASRPSTQEEGTASLASELLPKWRSLDPSLRVWLLALLALFVLSVLLIPVLLYSAR